MKRCLILLLALLALAAQAAWVDPTGKPVPETESMRSAGDFGVQILLTANEDQLRRAWASPRTPPTLATTNTVRRGATVAAMLIFGGCVPNGAGVCDVVSDYLVEGPTGQRMPANGGPVWSSKPMPPRQLQLGLSSLVFGFDKTDPLGEYKITATVRDRVSGKAVSVTARLNLTK